ncbi:F-actin-capping protein subunit beta [Chytridium lagenaria]|nr:F-actin-capping protein subunit beta [Chytridium lagenaria]
MDPIDVCLDLMRRLSPKNVESNLVKLIDLAPDLSEDLLSAVDQPLKVQRCPESGREYLLCDYNRDDKSYRSPWSNEYDPPLADGARPSAKLRKLEMFANDAFDTYRELYFDGGVSSVYMWDLDDGFASVVLIKKAVTDDVKGTWDSIHVIEVQEKGRSAHYKLTSTIMLNIEQKTGKLGETSLSGSLTRQAEQDCPVEEYNVHVENIGRIVEDMENKMRNSLNEIYFGKTKDIVNDLRSVYSIAEGKKQANIQAELVGKLVDRNR